MEKLLAVLERFRFIVKGKFCPKLPYWSCVVGLQSLPSLHSLPCGVVFSKFPAQSALIGAGLSTLAASRLTNRSLKFRGTEGVGSERGARLTSRGVWLRVF